jgi:hypothetical protein
MSAYSAFIDSAVTILLLLVTELETSKLEGDEP